MPQPFDQDKMMMLSRDRAATVAHEALDSIAALAPHEQMAAVAILFKVFTSRFRLDPESVFHYGNKLLRRTPFMRKGNAQMEALEAFAGLQDKGHL